MSAQTEIDAVNPSTGEILERLDQQPPEKLAEALDVINVRMIEYKRWQAALETELRRRLRLVDRNQYVWGGWEVVKTRSRESSWDADELNAVIESLIEEGVIKAQEAVDVVVQPPRIVKRENAKRLAARLTGANRKAVESCCEWKEKAGKLSVHQTVELGPGDEEGVIEGSVVTEIIDEVVEIAHAVTDEAPPQPSTAAEPEPTKPTESLEDLFA